MDFQNVVRVRYLLPAAYTYRSASMAPAEWNTRACLSSSLPCRSKVLPASLNLSLSKSHGWNPFRDSEQIGSTSKLNRSVLSRVRVPMQCPINSIRSFSSRHPQGLAYQGVFSSW
jgi:hypothetical protein